MLGTAFEEERILVDILYGKKHGRKL